jgi:hypothetical protein
VSDEELTVRSYGRVFRLERRIYRIDRFVLPLPGGLPVRALLYFLAALLATLALAVVPALDRVLSLVSPPLRYLVIPAGLAVLATQAAPDGRRAHRFALAWLGLRLRRRRTVSGRPLPPEAHLVRLAPVLPVAPDEHAPALRRARVRGPAVVRFREPVALVRRRRAWRARTPGSAGGEELASRVELANGERLEIEP